jgi:cytochrome c
MMTDLAMRGRMLLWTVALVTAAGAARAGGDAARGEKLYEDCGVNGVGPTLYGIFGRKAGELDDYRYSPALKRSGISRNC